MNRDRAIKSINDGLCAIFGEKSRDLFETEGGKLIELGIEAGKYWAHDLVKYSIYFSIDLGYQLRSSKRTIDEIKEFVSPECYKVLENYSKNDFDYIDKPFYGDYMKNYPQIEEATEIFLESLSIEDFTFEKPVAFDYLYSIKTSLDYDKFSIIGEGRLMLNWLEPDSIKLNLNGVEDEEYLENLLHPIAHDFFYLGMFIGRFETAKKEIDYIKTNIKNDLDDEWKEYLSSVVRKIWLEPYTHQEVLEIQAQGITGGFITEEQYEKKIKRNFT